MEHYKILALSGSLRKASYNTAAIRALKKLAPPNIEFTIGSIQTLPLFNPDIDEAQIPALSELLVAIKNADGIVIASPEYAHGISGVMKNALDWLVSSVEFPNKAIMLINTSPRARHAQEALREVLNTMSGNIIEKACVSIELLSSNLDVTGIVKNKSIAASLCKGLNEFCTGIDASKES